MNKKRKEIMESKMNIKRPSLFPLLLPLFAASCISSQPAIELAEAESQQDAKPSDVANFVNNNQVTELEYGHTFHGFVQSSLDASQDITFSILEKPQYGQVKLLHAKKGEFEYTSESADSTTDQFIMVAKDANGNQENISIAFNFSDTTSPNIVLSYPTDKAIQISHQPTLRLQFDDLMNIDTATFNSEDEACSGSIQISQNQFMDCVKISSISTTDKKLFFIELKDNLDLSTQYEVKINENLKNQVGLSANPASFSFFTAMDQLVITEVGRSESNRKQVWFEIFNFSGEPLSLSKYRLRTQALDKNRNDLMEAYLFDLPNVQIQPGAYHVISSMDLENDAMASTIEDVNYIPFWNNSGYIEIEEKQSGATVEFIAFGDKKASPQVAEAWLSEENAIPLSLDKKTNHWVISRDASNADTNQAQDWKVPVMATAGMPNDMECFEDIDHDGIPDCAEAPGKTFSNLPLYAWGARVGVTDIFIEVDYIDSEDEGVIPHQYALKKVAEVFASKNIALHFDVGDLPDTQYNDSVKNMGGGNKIPYIRRIEMDTLGMKSVAYDFHEVKQQNIDVFRQSIFYYVMFGTSMDDWGNAGASGRAEINGNDTLITLGEWGLNRKNVKEQNRLINYQAATLMHELGHNFGLRHGGFENQNLKPNYISVMNYIYQLNGVPHTGINDGDRIYDRFFRGNEKCYDKNLPVHASAWHSPLEFKIDYSNGSSMDLDKKSMDEQIGLGRSSSTPVDFNCDGDLNDTVNFEKKSKEKDKNKNKKSEKIIKDHNDWDALWFVNADKLEQSKAISSGQSTKSEVSRITEISEEYNPFL